MSEIATIEKIGRCIKDLFPDATDLTITPDTTLSEIPGWDSMSAVNLQTQLSAEFGVTVPEEMLTEETSLRDIVDHIMQSG